MSKLFTTTAACVLAAGLAAPVAAQDASTVVATVDGREITLGHMIALYDRLPENYRQLPPEQLFTGILDQLVDQTVLAEGQDLSDGARLTLENEERGLLASAAIADIADEAVSDEAVQEAYAARTDGMSAAQEYNASHILVETEEEAQALIEELEGGADFATLARENSTGPSGPSGGELGWFGPGQMVPEFDGAVQGMETGEVAGPVQTQFGWHVIRLNEVRDASIPPLETLRPEIESQIVQEAIQSELEARLSEADITRDVEGIDPALLTTLSLPEN
ncbi:peptidyl-prolyl cis-trans isomerase C [Palleronia aestuarii]|uniref:Parvulin-like PPIase n=1 Tax=Palleronia aestuarii TaxID=568105 RepID=A0A2W7NER1_9RHOB|nr:peptidylprolyl isomerase [Palleronia aestuarii]PZX18921.1 peptidyl-prolyl cis-trans isomerase C [Palleronia aestuarii]